MGSDGEPNIDADLLKLLVEGNLRDGRTRKELAEKHGDMAARVALALSNMKRNPELRKAMLLLLTATDDKTSADASALLQEIPADQMREIRSLLFTDDEAN